MCVNIAERLWGMRKGVTNVSLGCHQGHVLLLPRLLLLIPAALPPLNLTESTQISHSAQVASTHPASNHFQLFQQQIEGEKTPFAQLLMARVSSPDCCWGVQLGAGGAGQWPA